MLADVPMTENSVRQLHTDTNNYFPSNYYEEKCQYWATAHELVRVHDLYPDSAVDTFDQFARGMSLQRYATVACNWHCYLGVYRQDGQGFG